MRNVFLTLIAFVFVPSVLMAQDDEQRLYFPMVGYSIAPLQDEVGETPYQSIIMFLNASDGFAPNVNIQVQPFEDPFKDYVALSKEQFKQLNFSVIKEEMKEDSATWEYAGTVGPNQLHFYVVAKMKDGKVFLATASAKESQWKTVSEKMKACVDSFRFEKR